MNITVLYGGDSAEREVSLCSGARVSAALRESGHAVTLLDVRGMPSASELRKMRCADGVFLALHGGAGEDGRLQARLEQNGIFHYTGSAPAGAALAMHKESAKTCVQKAGVPVAAGVVLDRWQAALPLSVPFVCKPLCGGSSVGLAVIDAAKKWQELAPFGHFSEQMLCEAYLPGREFTVGVLEGETLPAVEIRPHGGQYDYRHKYTAGESDELCPAPIEAWEAECLSAYAKAAFDALSLRDYARIDFREDAVGTPCFLEANTLPGMTGTSLLPLSARAAGLSFSALCERMITLAANRKKT